MSNTNETGAAGLAAALPTDWLGPQTISGAWLGEPDGRSIRVAFCRATGQGIQFCMNAPSAVEMAQALRAGKAEVMENGTSGRVVVVTGRHGGHGESTSFELHMSASRADRVADFLEREAAKLAATAEVSA